MIISMSLMIFDLLKMRNAYIVYSYTVYCW